MDGVTGEAAPPLVGNWLPAVAERLAVASRLSLCLDFDGTLAPIVESPDDAAMPVRLRETLAALADRPRVDVAVVSGRGLADLRERVPVDGCALAGNHGLEMDRDGERWVHPEVADARPALERACRAVADHFDDVPDVRIEDKRVTATVHHRGADVDHDTVRAAVGSALDDESGLVATDGRKIVEIRPTVEWDKADAVRSLTDDDAAAAYVGDDTTDEDAFEVLDELPNGGVGVLVGDRPSAADFRVADVDGVRTFLEWLADADVPAVSTNGGGPAAASDGPTSSSSGF